MKSKYMDYVINPEAIKTLFPEMLVFELYLPFGLPFFMASHLQSKLGERGRA